MKYVSFNISALLFGIVALASLIFFLTDESHLELFIFIYFHLLLSAIITLHLTRSNSLSVYGMYLTAMMLIYFYANYTDYGLLYFIFLDGSINNKSVILLLFLVMLIAMGIYALIKGGVFFPISQNRLVIGSLLLLLIYLTLELPAYNQSIYDHGHSLWRGGHLH